LKLHTDGLQEIGDMLGGSRIFLSLQVDPFISSIRPERTSSRLLVTPNVGHERRLEACEARWKASARWTG
jgi:hypothetical protein